jgi:hypothetical protein
MAMGVYVLRWLDPVDSKKVPPELMHEIQSVRSLCMLQPDWLAGRGSKLESKRRLTLVMPKKYLCQFSSKIKIKSKSRSKAKEVGWA